MRGNAGAIYGVNLQGGGNVGNLNLIESGNGVYIKYGAGTVTNSGTILGTAGVGVFLSSGGRVDNTGPGLIEGAAPSRSAIPALSPERPAPAST